MATDLSIHDVAGRRRHASGEVVTSDEPSSVSEKRWLTIDQLAAIVPYRKSTLYYLVHVKAIPHVKKRGKLFFELNEITRWMEQDSRCKQSTL